MSEKGSAQFYVEMRRLGKPVSDVTQRRIGDMWRAEGSPTSGKLYAQLTQEVAKIAYTYRARLQKEGRLPAFEFDDLDPVQDAMVKALERLPEWDPARGALTTFLYPILKGAMMESQNAELKSGIGSRTASVVIVPLGGDPSGDDLETVVNAGDDEQDQMTAQLTYEGMRLPYGAVQAASYASDAIPGPEPMAERAKLLEWMRSNLSVLDFDILYSALEGSRPEDIAERIGTSSRTIRRRIEKLTRLIVSNRRGE